MTADRPVAGVDRQFPPRRTPEDRLGAAAPTHPTISEDIDVRDFRRVMSQFCTGIVVVTAMAASTPVGLTCQSFCSLSLRPPLVMFGVATSSQSWPQIRSAGRFAVNVLGEHQERISRAFAVSQADKFVDVSWHLGAGGAPLIEDALAHIQCTLHAVHDGGDHEIAIGRVLALNERADGTGPLVYFRGEYRLLRYP